MGEKVRWYRKKLRQDSLTQEDVGYDERDLR